jgi:SAM-dependent methyltransferase
MMRLHEIEWTDSQVSRLWDYYARTPPYSEMFFARRFGRQLLRESGLPLRQPLEVLDFGCGPGYIWDHLQDLHAQWQYSALDFSQASVAALQRRGEGHDRFRGAIHVSSLPTALPASRFDAVLLFEVVEHLNDQHLQATMQEAARLLKPGGMLVISTPNDEDLSQSHRFCPSCGAIFHQWQHVRSWRFETLARYLDAYGFSPSHHRTTDFEAMEQTLGSRLLAARNLVRSLLRRPRRDPHLVAVFRRS